MVLIDQENRQIPLVAAAIFNSDGELGVQVSFATANSQDDKEAAQEVFTSICTDAALLNFNSQLVLMDENTKLQMNRNDPVLDIPRYFIGMAVTENNNLVITNIKEVDDYLACCTCLGMVVKNTEKPASNYLVPRLMKHMTETAVLNPKVAGAVSQMFLEGTVAVKCRSEEEYKAIKQTLSNHNFLCDNTVQPEYWNNWRKYIYFNPTKGVVSAFIRLPDTIDGIIDAAALSASLGNN